MKPQSFLVRVIKHQIQATIRLIKQGSKEYILQLLTLDKELEEAMSEQLKYSEAQIQAAFSEVKACLKRQWKPEMTDVINRLVGQGIDPLGTWNYKAQFPIILEMADNLRWRDATILVCLQTAEYLEKQKQ
jgi:hypothetical protein